MTPKNTTFFRNTLLGVLLLFAGSMALAKTTTHLYGDEAQKVYTDLNLSSGNDKGVIYLTETVSERRNPAYLYHLVFTIGGWNQNISLEQDEKAVLFSIIQESGIMPRGVIGGSQYSWLRVNVSCSKENGYSCTLTNLGDENSIKQTGNISFSAKASDQRFYLMNSLQPASSCRTECSASGGQACGGRYGVCCYRVCD